MSKHPSATRPRCGRHGQPLHGATLCSACVSDLRKALARVADVATDLDLAVSRQTAFGPVERIGHSRETAIYYDPEAAEVLWNLKVTLVAQVRDLEPDITRHPADNYASIAGWLHDRIPEIRTHIAGDAILDEITYAVDAAVKQVDVPNRGRITVPAPYACPDCGGQLRVYLREASYMKCQACGTEWATEQWLDVGKRIIANSLRRESA